MKANLMGLYAEEIAALIQAQGLESYRAKQIAEWIYRGNASDFAAMTNLSKSQRELLNEHYYIGQLTEQDRQESQDGRTSKYLLAMEDGQAIETVWMRQPYGNSVCVSTQAGCAMGCQFCASTIGGLVRNLTAGEILSQVLFVNRLAKEDDGNVNTIVIMGSGEPLANYEEVLRFIKLCHANYSLNLSYRSITLSTSGVVPGIERLDEEKIPINLSISLHAPNNAVRSAIMPVNRRYPIESVLEAAGQYARTTGRRVTYEYTLIKDVNDQIEHARELAGRIKGQLANVNLIPVNPVPERGLLRPRPETIEKFAGELKRQRINVTVRREMGTDIQAACGQLRNKSIAGQNRAGES